MNTIELDSFETHKDVICDINDISTMFLSFPILTLGHQVIPSYSLISSAGLGQYREHRIYSPRVSGSIPGRDIIFT